MHTLVSGYQAMKKRAPEMLVIPNEQQKLPYDCHIREPLLWCTSFAHLRTLVTMHYTEILEIAV